MKKIGIMGGTFSPIHIGHLLLAQWALDAENLDEIWFIPTGRSYLKANVDMPSATERYEMTRLAVEGNSRMKCLDLEIKREGNTYTCDTLVELHKEYPDYHFHFIFGADCLFTIENWRNPELIFEHCTIIAAVRGDTPMTEMTGKKAELEEKYNADIHLLPFLQLEISSTLVRDRLAQKNSVKYLVPDDVIAYIKEKGLYGF